MEIPLQISFRNVERSAVLEDDIRQRATKLDAFYNHVMSCRVVVDMPHRHHRRGNLYHVRIDITIPGGEIVVNREPPQHAAYKDLPVALRDAFASAVRQLEDYARRQRGDVKTHAVLPHGKVMRLPAGADYGFLESLDGREIYFHRNSVVDGDFDQLQVGTEVAFAEELGEKGPQATTVHVVGRHHHAL